MTVEALYVGGGKERVFQDGNSVINIELNLTDLETKMEGHVHTWRSRKGGGTEQKTIKLILAPLKNPDERRTHSLKIDTWKPDKPKPEHAGSYYTPRGGVERMRDEIGGQEPPDSVPF
jgi:hypothetical protein